MTAGTPHRLPVNRYDATHITGQLSALLRATERELGDLGDREALQRGVWLLNLAAELVDLLQVLVEDEARHRVTGTHEQSKGNA